MNPALKIINEYIHMLDAGRVEELNQRQASKQEIEFGIALLQAITADIEALPQS